jgi:hypothetical protein
MSLWTQRAELGRVEPYLRFIGLTVWFFVGFSRWHRAMPTPTWVWPWLGFGFAFLVSSLHRTLPSWVCRLALGAQALCVLSLPPLRTERKVIETRLERQHSYSSSAGSSTSARAT